MDDSGVAAEPIVVRGLGALQRTVANADDRGHLGSLVEAEVVDWVWRAVESSGCAVLSLAVLDVLLLQGSRSSLSIRREAAEMFASRHTTPAAPLDWPDVLVAWETARGVAERMGDPHLRRRRQLAAVVAAHLGLDAAAGRWLADQELELVRANSSANPVMTKVLNRFTKTGGQVVGCCDFGFVERDLRALLEEFLEDADVIARVFADVPGGGPRRLREFFAGAAEQLGHPPTELLHIGADIDRDFRVALSAGWRALHYPIASMEARKRAADHQRTVDELCSRGFGGCSWFEVAHGSL